MAEEVKLIGLSMSMFVIRVKIALNLKGVKYENLEETFGSKSELLLKSNPIYKKVPVLIHNGKTICESMIIVQYVDDVWSDAGPSIVPSDPFDAAMARFWSYYIDDKVKTMKTKLFFFPFVQFLMMFFPGYCCSGFLLMEK